MIIVKIYEGLGNQLFQYAFARSIQVNGKKVFLDTSGYTDQLFPLCRTSTRRRYQLNCFNIRIKEVEKKNIEKYSFLIQEDMFGKLISKLAKLHLWMYKVTIQQNAQEYKESYLNTRGNVYYKGWFQNPKYFSSIRRLLLKEITPKYKIRIPAELRELLQEDNIVAVHCRRGDYQYIRNCLPVNYYKKAMAYMEKKLGVPRYLFFSDDLSWVKRQFGNKDNNYYIEDYGKFEDYQELMIMSRCRNFIIANSTFSWWAAWLCSYENKVVIMPRVWTYVGGQGVEMSDFPADWIRI
ncbi:MAG: alpha-1,2-fucosyltransferase [Lachnospiraceae bacterium]|nr:hypothetical protein C804_01650 [Lachnospiraceae bacterium A4]MCI8267700.1 alpha-1,2-fucosyltransferase [Lachnospiraceae bacterium]